MVNVMANTLAAGNGFFKMWKVYRLSIRESILKILLVQKPAERAQLNLNSLWLKWLPKNNQPTAEWHTLELNNESNNE